MRARSCDTDIEVRGQTALYFVRLPRVRTRQAIRFGTQETIKEYSGSMDRRSCRRLWTIGAAQWTPDLACNVMPLRRPAIGGPSRGRMDIHRAGQTQLKALRAFSIPSSAGSHAVICPSHLSGGQVARQLRRRPRPMEFSGRHPGPDDPS